jgi:hypothetical protein
MGNVAKRICSIFAINLSTQHYTTSIHWNGRPIDDPALFRTQERNHLRDLRSIAQESVASTPEVKRLTFEFMLGTLRLFLLEREFELPSPKLRDDRPIDTPTLFRTQKD